MSTSFKSIHRANDVWGRESGNFQLANHLLRPNYANLLPTLAMKYPELPVLPHVSPIIENGLPLVVLKSNPRLKFRLNGPNGPNLASF